MDLSSGATNDQQGDITGSTPAAPAPDTSAPTSPAGTPDASSAGTSGAQPEPKPASPLANPPAPDATEAGSAPPNAQSKLVPTPPAAKNTARDAARDREYHAQQVELFARAAPDSPGHYVRLAAYFGTAPQVVAFDPEAFKLAFETRRYQDSLRKQRLPKEADDVVAQNLPSQGNQAHFIRASYPVNETNDPANRRPTSATADAPRNAPPNSSNQGNGEKQDKFAPLFEVLDKYPDISSNFDLMHPKLKEVTPELRPFLREVIMRQWLKGWIPTIQQAKRPEEEEKKHIQDGTSGLSDPKNTKHLDLGRGADAADVTDARYAWGKEKGTAEQARAYFKDQQESFEETKRRWGEAGDRFVWGGYWHKPYDPPHIENSKRVKPPATEEGAAAAPKIIDTPK